jgi:hypothetical protein
MKNCCLVACVLGCGLACSNAPSSAGMDAALAGADGGGVAAVDAASETPDAAAPGLDADVPDTGPGILASASFSVLATKTLRTVASGHLAFPDVTRTREGRILLVYREGASHQDPAGKIVRQVGSANATVWTGPQVIVDVAGVDDRDPSVSTLANGDVVLDYFQYSTFSFSGSLTVHHVFSALSTDNGAHFGALTEVDVGPMSMASASLTNGVWLDDQGQPIVVQACSSSVVEDGGRWLVPAYGGKALDMTDLAGSERSRISLYVSTDLGAHFTQRLVAPEKGADRWLMEPALLKVGPQKLLMHVRTATGASPGNPGPMTQIVSEDDGATWSSYVDFAFVGHAPELLQMKSGVLVSAFRELDGAFTQEWVSFIWSVDGGATWTAPTRVVDCLGVECGYPALLELDGDQFLLVYYAPGGTGIESATYRASLTYR